MAYQLYIIEFLNGKVYFGITSQPLAKRWSEHCKNVWRRSSYPLYRALAKYGRDTARIKVLAIGDRDYIRTLEVLAIEQFQTRDRRFGYNLALGGDISPMHVPEIAAKVSDTKKRVGLTDNMRAAHARGIGRKASEETIEKLRRSHLGKKWSDEQRQRSVGRQSPKKGISVSEEQKEKIRLAKREWFQIESNREKHIAVCQNACRRAKISAALMGHPGALKGEKRSAEIGARISSSKMGHAVSSETRKKLSAALKGRPLRKSIAS